MATGHLNGVISHLRSAMLLRDGAGLTDGQLLEDYLSRHDEAALAALLQRHGPMVWGVCCRVLSNYHDSEDAFQATFLVLVRRAASIASPELLANWLYGVAHQTAIKARATVAKRKMRERQVSEMPDPAGVEQDLWNDLQPLLDQELSRLPDKYRGVIVLCDLEGKTRKEAAGQLGCAEGTVASRLARARIMLAKRLTQRGVALSGGALAAVLAQQAASAGVPYSVVDSTIKAATLLAAGKAAATGAISVKVAALTEGVMKAMLFSKLRAAIAIVLILGFVATGASILTCRTAAGQADKKPAAEKPVEPAAKQEKEKETFTAWGKEVGGLQAGLGFRPGEKRAYATGETVPLAVRVRNVGKENVKFQYLSSFFNETQPTVTNRDGKSVLPKGRFLSTAIFDPPENVDLAPGKEIELYELKLELLPEEKRAVRRIWQSPIFGTGKFHVEYERLLGNSTIGKIALDPALSKLATGKLELEVKEPEKQPQKKEEKESFTSWGKEINGLQAGLGFRPGQKRAYRHGENATIVLRVRNVGKEAVEFKHIYAFFVENPPTITDADGKIVKLPPGRSLGLEQGAALPQHRPRSTNLSAGDEADICKWEFDLQPKGGIGINKEVLAIHGTGKFSVQCEHVVGPTFGNPNHPDPTLDKLATGKLELEVKEAVKLPEKKQEKEVFTAWGKELSGRGLHMGKEVNGLQAGLGFRPGEKRAYSHGETVKLVVRIRNVSKKEVTFKYIPAYFFDHPPSVTDGEGKAAPQIRLPTDGHEGEYNPKELTLAPGEEVELAEVKLELRPASESGNKKVNTLYGTGKFQIDYERLMYSSGKHDIGSILSDLATGKLELEVKPKPPAAPEKK